MNGNPEEEVEVFEPSEDPEEFDPDLKVQDQGEDYEDA